MKKELNVVIINDFDYIQGGASKVAIDTANILVKEGYNVYFFSGDTINNNDLDIKVIRICTKQGESLKNKNKFKGFVNGIYNFKAKRQLKNLLKKLDKNNTIIHIHGWTKVLSSSIFDAAFKMKFKIVLTMHDYFTACPNGGYYNYKKNEICHLKPMSCECCKCNCDSRNYFFKLYRIFRQFVQNKIVKLNDRLTDVISISNFSEIVLKKTLNSKTRIHKVYNPIDLDLNAKKVDYKNNNYYLYVGRVSPEKGVDIFCKAITELKLKGVVVGDGPNLKTLQKKFPNIEYVGWKSPKEVKEYMRKARALIFPSRWYEAAPLTPLEAIQYGIPIISSNCNATVDYIKDGENGKIFADIKELKNILSDNLTLKDITYDFSNNKKYAENIVNVYNKVGGKVND